MFTGVGEDSESLLCCLCCCFPFSIVLLPIEIIKGISSRLGYVGNRVGKFQVIPQFIALLLLILIASSAVSPINVKFLIGFFFVCEFFTIVPFLRTLRFDSAWVEIPGFMKHRDISAWNFGNLLAVFSLGIRFFQIGGLGASLWPKKTTTNPEYEAFKEKIISFFEVFILSVDIDINIGFAYATISIVFFLFIISVHPIISLIYVSTYIHGENPTEKSDRMARMDDLMKDIHPEGHCLKQIREFLMGILMDTASITIITKLLHNVDCTYSSTSATLDNDPSIACWKGEHLIYGTLSLLCIYIYIPITVLFSPFLVSLSGDSINQGQDVRYSPVFQFQTICTEIAIVIASVFLGAVFPWIGNVIIMIGNGFLVYAVENQFPCSVIWINILKTAFYSWTSILSFCILIDLLAIPWLAFIIFAIGFSIIFFHTLFRIRKVFGGAPNFVELEVTGKTHQDTTKWSDVSIFRGIEHKITSIRIRANKDSGSIFSLQVIYKVNAKTIYGPLHQGFHVSENVPWHTFSVASDDDISKIVLWYGGLIDGIEIYTKKNKEIKLGKLEGNTKTFENWNGHLVGFHGGSGGHVHNLGIIVQINEKNMKQKNNSEEKNDTGSALL